MDETPECPDEKRPDSLTTSWTDRDNETDQNHCETTCTEKRNDDTAQVSSPNYEMNTTNVNPVELHGSSSKKEDLVECSSATMERIPTDKHEPDLLNVVDTSRSDRTERRTTDDPASTATVLSTTISSGSASSTTAIDHDASDHCHALPQQRPPGASIRSLVSLKRDAHIDHRLPGAFHHSLSTGRHAQRRPPLPHFHGGHVAKRCASEQETSPPTTRNRFGSSFSSSDDEDSISMEEDPERVSTQDDSGLISATLVDEWDPPTRRPTPQRARTTSWVLNDFYRLPLVDARTLPDTPRSRHDTNHNDDDDGPPPQPERLPETSSASDPQADGSVSNQKRWSTTMACLKQKNSLWVFFVILVVSIVLSIALAMTVGGGGGDTKNFMATKGKHTDGPHSTSPTPLKSVTPSVSMAPSSMPTLTPSTRPSNSQIPTMTPSLSSKPSSAPTRSISEMEQMLRTNYAQVFQEHRDPYENHDESLYWMKALRYVERTSQDMEHWRIAQRYAIACIFYATDGVETPYSMANAETGTSMRRHTWLDGADTENECQWGGINCEYEGDWHHAIGRVSAFSIWERTIMGTFPMEVILLKETLLYLKLGNNLISNIGLENLWWLGELTQLTNLRLPNTGFAYDQGLPPGLASLTNLVEPYLSNSLFSGPWNGFDIFENMTNLVTLDLTGLDLTMTPKTFGLLPPLPKLEILKLSNIPLNGTLSLQLPDFPQLQELNIANADLTGGLVSLFSFPSNESTATDYSPILRILNLSKNPKLGGTLPSTIGRYTSLRDIQMSQCGLTGQIPTELGLLTKLHSLNLNGNFFNDSFPLN